VPSRWRSKNAPPSLPCEHCMTEVIPRSPRQRFCSVTCQSRHYRQFHPDLHVWGTPEYYERKQLEKSGFKKCKQCKEVLPLTEYWRARHLFRSRCKTCDAARQRLLRKPDTDTLAKRLRARKWRETHRELAAQRIRDWGARHPEHGAEAARRRRARKANNGIYVVTVDDLRRLLIRQRLQCYMCQGPLAKKKHLDHILPIKRGGRHSIGNLAWSCIKCNLTKNARLLAEVRYQ